MLFPIPKITRAIALTDYAPEFVDGDGKAIVIRVWVNPPAAQIGAHTDAVREIGDLVEKLKAAQGDDVAAIGAKLSDAGRRVNEFYALVWEQTADDVAALANDADNPALYTWLCVRTWAEINDHRYGVKKKLTPP